MSVSIELHPLAVLNISDHLTRAKYQMGKDSDYRVIGALLGKQNGRSLDIVNTVEVKFGIGLDRKEQRDRIDEAFCQGRLEAYKKIFPDLECIGWYSASKGSADAPNANDIILHKKFQKFSENPLLAILNPESIEAAKKKILPLFLFEQEAAGGQGFIKLDYTLATSDSERIAVDHIAKAMDSSTSSKTSQLSQNMISSLNALKLLRRKIRFLLDIVRNSPEVRADHNFMRRLQQICALLPIADRETFDENAFKEYADVAAVNMLATVVKGSEMLNSLADDFKLYQSGSNSFENAGVDIDGILGEGNPLLSRGNSKGGFFNNFR